VPSLHTAYGKRCRSYLTRIICVVWLSAATPRSAAHSTAQAQSRARIVAGPNGPHAAAAVPVLTCAAAGRLRRRTLRLWEGLAGWRGRRPARGQPPVWGLAGRAAFSRRCNATTRAHRCAPALPRCHACHARGQVAQSRSAGAKRARERFIASSIRFYQHNHPSAQAPHSCGGPAAASSSASLSALIAA
jgi:hypothetical protein